jgi:hypothetical protein
VTGSGGAAPDGAPWSGSARAGDRRVVAIGASLAVVPVVVAAARAVVRGWVPMGDNAYFTIRARDVLTEHHPLLGAWSSGSASVGELVNNLGPLQLDLLALPAKLDGDAGTAIGVALLNVAAVLGAVWAARRAAGTPAALAVAAVAAGLCWSLGSELLIEPRQHHAMVLPFLCVLVLAWAVAAGVAAALPWLALAASLVVQTHLSFVVPAAVVVAAALAWWLWAPTTGFLRTAVDETATDVRRNVGWAALVVVVAWAQPVWEQVRAPSGEGNLSALLSAAGEGDGGRGLAHGARSVAAVVGLPPWWGRPGFRDFDPAAGLPGAGATALGLVLVLGVLVGAWLVARRSTRPGLTALSVVAAAASAGALVAASTTPAAEPFGPVAGNYRWLWPTAALVTVTVLLALDALVGARRRLVHGVMGALLVAGAVLALPTAYGSPGPEADAPLIPVARELRGQLGALEGRGTLLVERGGLHFGEPFTYVVLAELQRRGIPFVLDDPVDERRFGSGRRHDGRADGVIRFVSGDDAVAPPGPGETTVAFATALDDAERSERDALRREPRPEAASARRLAELEDRWARGTVAVRYRPDGGGGASAGASGRTERTSQSAAGAATSARTGWYGTR